MEEQVFSLLDTGLPLKSSKNTRRPVTSKPVRFLKLGSNAHHPLTLEIRKIKDNLHLTTGQLVKELNSFEKKYRKKDMGRKGPDGSPTFLPMKSVLMSAYLQGWVLQEPFMASVCERLQALQTHCLSREKAFGVDLPMREIMDKWFSELGIVKGDPAISPFRAMAKQIAPFYKRPVLCGDAGVFTLGGMKDGFRIYTIESESGEKNSYLLDPKEPILINENDSVEVGDLIQFAVLMRIQLEGGEYKITQDPSIDHTTFYRWYQTNKKPRSIKTLEMVQLAVEQAKTAAKEAK